MNRNILAFVVVLLLCGGGCGSSKLDVKEPSTPSIEEAQKIVDAYAARFNIETARTVDGPPSSLPEVIEIFKNDEVARFEQAIQYLRGVEGPDALSLRASIEIYGAGLQLGIADFLFANANKKNASASSLVEKKNRGEKLGTDEENQLALLQDTARELNEVGNALKVLAQTHLQSGEASADDMIRLFPDKPDGYSAKAGVYRLRGEWKEYDEQVAQAERMQGDPQSFGLQYQKAFEEWKRNASPEEGIKAMTALRDAFPGYVRIQATLVLMQQDVEATYREFVKLKELSPRHPLVILAGSTIQKEYEAGRAFKDAKAEVEGVSP